MTQPPDEPRDAPDFARGGVVYRSGDPTDDSIPVALDGGWIPAAEVRAYGAELCRRINARIDEADEVES